ncbi:MAG: ferric iron uptake transcriptional regulator [Gammaproteobacteria bacterium]|nr:ferric iron uptake transcriptional regulator [Gammaproteobacteria bacterium]
MDLEQDAGVTEIPTKLKRAGLKITLPRIKILELLEQHQDRHFTAEGLYDKLRQEGEDIGVATIYRVLTQCEQAGLVQRLQFEGGRAVFELADSHHHDHIVCVRCGHVEEFHDDVIEKRQQDIADKAGYKIEDHTMVLYGLCPSCLKDDE